MTPIDLQPKASPTQQRSVRTLERILVVTGRLLEERGFERVSTNIVAEEAGISVPALYRYFPNKYALVKSLGERLMERQNLVLEAVLSSDAHMDELLSSSEILERLLLQTVEVTEVEPGALAIIQSMRAAPPLAEVRVKAHDRVAKLFCKLVEKKVGTDDIPDTLEQHMRLVTEIGYLTVELLLEDKNLDRDYVIKQAAASIHHLIVSWWQQHGLQLNNVA